MLPAMTAYETQNIKNINITAEKTKQNTGRKKQKGTLYIILNYFNMYATCFFYKSASKFTRHVCHEILNTV
jgi:hypothetical protein